ncbi:ATP citrate lyase, alpha subunit [Candidatus Bipolaricaulis anaerobius]|jgi:ATP-citrate lyase alpha-subunit|uniref:ATP citrate lyase, alpha subunit n=1 Tax=Candidatus Bipolaricaulis anaerobius TaxID=2026885 RepID=A0A2X3L1T0_9BACT|nr:citrate/2-methylcitrate synthase [Candidatus Bipolaricaulis anaerobius]SQD92760.1 ATP citrate lyase, alpha subunit [Candidatus Bipolaricaulis anaerobius]
MRNDYELFTADTKAFIYGEQLRAAQRMLDFDYLCRRAEPSVAALITPERGGFEKLFWGTKEIRIPRMTSLAEAAALFPEADVLVNFASQRSAYDVTVQALDIPTIRTIAVIAEGIPERQSRRMAALARAKGKWIIGPATVGGVKAGCFKIGNAAGTMENIREAKLYRPGSVGFVSVSGGLSNEAYNIVARATDGLNEGIAIGGDAYPGSTLLDHLLRFERNPAIKLLVCLGEVGGTKEYEIAEAVKAGRITKPLVMWVTGTCAKVLPGQVQFGHAGARADTAAETADAKNAALREAGVIVPHSFDDYGLMIEETYERLVAEGVIVPAPEVTPPTIPLDYAQARAEGLVRRPTHFISTICDERGDVHNYCGVPIDRVIEEEYGIGGVIGLLWFKKDIPPYAREFIEMVIQVIADHGPAVSGAHNTIVAARAGKDLISSLVSGILTIGPRFGGAVNGAADHFLYGLRNKLAPREFVDEMKRRNVRIQGIGHRLHSLENPDARVELMKAFAREHFRATPLLDYALAVEAVTTQKKGNLILNVDGCIGVLLVDLLTELKFTDAEIDEMIRAGLFNAFFVLGRSIGLIGHYFDQVRLEQDLYRHPLDDILYDVPPAPEKVG